MVTAAMNLAITPLRVTATAKVPAARHRIRRLATTLLDADTAADVELMASEAITNALLHGHGDATVTVTCDEKTLRVEVYDHGPGLLIARRVDHGQGLKIIDKLADRWGLDTGADGTHLWFEVDRGASE